MADLVDQINLQVQGVHSNTGANNQLIISNNTGNQIAIGGNSHLVGLTAATYEGMYSLVNVDGSATKIELGNLANGYVQEVDATVAHLNLFGLNETDGAGKLKVLLLVQML